MSHRDVPRFHSRPGDGDLRKRVDINDSTFICGSSALIAGSTSVSTDNGTPRSIGVDARSSLRSWLEPPTTGSFPVVNAFNPETLAER